MLRSLSAVALAAAVSLAPALHAQDAPPAAPAAPAAAETKPAETPPATPPVTPPDAPPADAKPAAPPADAAPQMGALSVSATPNGKVFIDGKDTGLTTPVVDMPVAAGPHTLRVVEEATGRETSTEFTMGAGDSLNLNLNLPEAAPKAADPAVATPPAGDVATPTPGATSGAEAEAPWTWMTVAGWSGLGLGVIGLLSGSVVLTTPTDPDQGPLGFGLFGAGVGLLIGGGVLLYLDTELADSNAANTGPAPAEPAAEGAPAAAASR